MNSEKIAQALDNCPRYLSKVKRTFNRDERITLLLNEIVEEIDQLHIDREKQELAVFKIAYKEGYEAALKDVEERRLKN